MSEPVAGGATPGTVWTSDHEAPALAWGPAAACGDAVDHADPPLGLATEPVPRLPDKLSVLTASEPVLGVVASRGAESAARRPAPAAPGAPGGTRPAGGGPRAELDWDRALALIETADEICLACHVAPDGDALGSMLALGQALSGLGKRCLASFGEPFTVPGSLRFLPGQELLVEPARMPGIPKVMITLDAAGVERLGSLAGRAAVAGSLIVVDHHASNTGFGAVRLVDPDAAATAVLVEELIRRLGAPLTGDIAQGLYAGLASDTGSFKYPCTTPQVHDLAGRLLAAGVRPEAVSRELWDRAPFGYLMVLAGALARARLEREAAGGLGLVWTSIGRAERDSRGVPYDQLEGVIDQLRRTDEAEVAVVCKQNDQGEWYVSTRSKGRVDVGRACVALGGGGHRTAAAFTLAGEPATIIDRLRAALKKDEAA
ncbi:bifunctional oligoribonuclease/PAP phosphatase NrnA [Actinomadura viridis]|uniref:Phosphoesterase RecJ-like protein n=1 Tax=Actinomadura viridis TaxID=58110 RepID=A0A931DFN7_9ACTN|nr:bifunctional oligoribonuclease/PAP phosphatase NrnA [Actinomadura viridis]MBG6087924.1 phosphoesterase RecJ-like protein [Actinomadura viridis]